MSVCFFILFFFILYVVSFSGLSIFDCPFGILDVYLHGGYYVCDAYRKT